MTTTINLKTTVIALGAMAMLTTSCDKDRWPHCVKANGKTTTETRTVDNFKHIEFEGSGDVFLYQSTDKTSPTIEIEASDNIMDRIKTEVNGDRLKISSDCIRGDSKMKFTIHVADLNSVNIDGSANVTTMTEFAADELLLKICGSGDIQYDVEATDITCDISGSGDIELNGSTNVLDIEIDGSGDVHAFDLPSTDCFIDISGSGDCEVFVNGALDVMISGSGDVVYDGQPTSFNTDNSGSGTVRKR